MDIASPVLTIKWNIFVTILGAKLVLIDTAHVQEYLDMR